MSLIENIIFAIAFIVVAGGVIFLAHQEDKRDKKRAENKEE